MRHVLTGLLVAWIAAGSAAAMAGAEDKDLDRIADLAAMAADPVTAASPGTLFAENDTTVSARRSELPIPLPPGRFADWQERLSLDGRGAWQIGRDLSVTVSDRLTGRVEDDLKPSAPLGMENDLREGYVSWEVAPQSYLEVGRINLKNGVALGYNPTDFFKAGSLVDQASQDPGQLRDNRLGSAMLRAQTIWGDGSASLAAAPRLTRPGRIDSAAAPRLDPAFDQTNGDDRFLLCVSQDLPASLSPQFLLLQQDGKTRYGANLSLGVGDAIIVYGEWAAARQATLASRAFAYGRMTGSLPATAPALLGAGGATAFSNDLVLGGSWTGSAKLTVNLEYQGHQSGFSGQDWRTWFGLGAAARATPTIAGELWYLRAYAQDQQEPMTRHQLFLRAVWSDAFVRNLELRALSFVNLYDGSRQAQISLSYFVSDRWTITALAGGTFGAARSESGSLPQRGSVVLQLIAYL